MIYSKQRSDPSWQNIEFEENAIFHQQNKADPEVIGKAFEDIARKHENQLRAHDVLDEARRRNHPSTSAFHLG